LCKRSALGVGRCGSYASHGSGEIMLAFSTANKVPRKTEGMATQITVMLDRATAPLYEAVIEATEEAVVNALCLADDMTGKDGHHAPALPLDRVVTLLTDLRPKP
jgi:D-aminopeptidase